MSTIIKTIRALPGNEFVAKSRNHLRVQGRRRGPRTPHDLDFHRSSATYGLYEMMTSHPWLETAIRQVHAQPYTVMDRQVTSQAHPDQARLLRTLVRERKFHVHPPHQQQIPKFKPIGALCQDDLDRHWRADPDYLQGSAARTLTIDRTDHRILAVAAQMVLAAFYQGRWSTTVASRPGTSVVDVVMSLRHAMQQTRRRVLLMADISAFFDSIPTEQALDILDRDIGYRSDPQLKQHIEMLIRWPEMKHLPQGNPLSPLLANLYAAQHIDPLAQHLGPAIRYVDDLAIAVTSVDEARAAFTRLQTHLAGVGHGTVQLNQAKSCIVDFHAGTMYACDEAMTQVPFDPVYLGFRLQHSPAVFDLALSDKALWSLFEHLRAATFNPALRHGRNPDPEQWLSVYLSQVMPILCGWYEWYGGASISDEQQEVLWELVDRVSGLPILRQATSSSDPDSILKSRPDFFGMVSRHLVNAGIFPNPFENITSHLFNIALANRFMEAKQRSSQRVVMAQWQPVPLYWYPTHDRSWPESTVPALSKDHRRLWIAHPTVMPEADQPPRLLLLPASNQHAAAPTLDINAAMPVSA